MADAKANQARRASDQAKIREDRAARDKVPFTGNTAGQPIDKSPIPFNKGGVLSVLDGDKAALDAKASRDAVAASRAKPAAKQAVKRGR